jgi:hypothetical protein
MGVAGCGKSAVGQRVAQALNLPLIEGDDFHPQRNIHKMQQGIALTDDDRADWLRLLGEQLAAQPAGAVLTCSALKRAYRDTLRAAAPGLRFVHLAITQAESLAPRGRAPRPLLPAQPGGQPVRGAAGPNGRARRAEPGRQRPTGRIGPAGCRLDKFNNA